MNAPYTAALLIFLVALAALLIRYVNLTVDREFRSLARSAEDGEFRREEIARADALLAKSLPLPADVRPLSGPTSGARNAVAPVLLALGIILLWGAGSSPDGTASTWLYGGLTAMALSGLLMLGSLSRRRWARVARMLLFRADLKRMEGDREGSAEDMRGVLRLTPWDDAAWSEYSDDLAANGLLPEALEAMNRAVELDPRYDEYRMVAASLAIRAGRLDDAREAVRQWRELDGVEEDDPRLNIYMAALALAEGDRDEAEKLLEKALLDEDGGGHGFLDMDRALAEVKDLLPGRA